MSDLELLELLRFEESVRGMIHGEYPGMDAGRGGLEFDHLKRWEPGDLPRDINRAASYRRGKLVVNVRLPERELEVVFLADTSSSMKFASRERSKEERMRAFISRAIELGEEERPFFSLLYHEESDLHFVPLGTPDAARKRFAEMDMLGRARANVFQLLPALRFLRKRGEGRTCAILVFSDFAGVPHDYAGELRALVRMGHKVCGIAIVDAFEVAMPAVPFGVLRMHDAETGAGFLAAGSREFLAPHEELFRAAHGTFAVFCDQEEGEKQ